jgi:hypothetical protein
LRTNDLGDCIRKAVDDSSSFYEIAYYPDSENWNGEYRRVSVVVRQPGVHLAYRQGYFARPEGNENSKDQKAELQQAACEDYLNATAISLTAKSMPPDSPEKLKFYLRINESRLTLTPTLDGGRELNLAVAVCTLDQVGWPFQFMSDMIRRNFNAKEYQSLSANGLPHIISIPGPKPAAIRILVEDIPSGRIGSVYIKVDDTLAVPSAAATEKGMQQTAQ